MKEAETNKQKVGDVIDIYADGDYNSPSRGLVICSGEIARTQDGEYCAAIVCYVAEAAKYVWACRDDKGDWAQISREMHCEISAEFDTIIEALVHG